MNAAPGPATTPASARPDAAYGIESVIARLLVAGTYIAVALVLVGVAGMLLTGVDPLTHATPPGFDLARLPGDIVALRPEGFLWAGLVIVMALPLGRVAVSGLGFLRAGDRQLALVSVAVLLVVLVSIFAALGLGG